MNSLMNRLIKPTAGFKGLGLLLASLLLLSACAKEPLTIESVQILTDVDRGSGNFNRVLEICLDKPIPLKQAYYHTMTLETHDGYQLSGSSWLRHRASDPRNPCQLRNLYLYLGRDDPPGSRQLIDQFVNPGQIREIVITLYDEKPETGRERPVDQRRFENL